MLAQAYTTIAHHLIEEININIMSSPSIVGELKANWDRARCSCANTSVRAPFDQLSKDHPHRR